MQSSTTQLEITYLHTTSLKPDPRNPRVHSDKQVRQIAQSIESFGFNVPLLIDDEQRVIAGHGRLLAARKLGWATVPAIRLSHLTESQRMAFLIADNRLTENSSWDERMLGEQLKILSELELDFDLETIGFEVPEIDLLIDGLNTVPEADPDDRLPEVSETAVTVSGDLWQLGKHRVFCGDSLSTASYERLMEGAKADLVIADPPYNVVIDGHATGNGSVHHREFAMASGEMSSTEFTEFLRKAMLAARDHSVAGSLAYYFMDWRHMTEILSAGRQVYTELLNLCVWAKSNGGMGSFYRSAHELVFLFKNGTGSHRNNIQLGKFGRYRTNVWNYPGANAFSRSDSEGNLLALHPTPKPVALIEDAIKDCTARGDVVLDPFLGSGTAVIAAERAGRRCYGLELDPLYVDIIIRRWQRQTKLDAVHVETGELFDSREARGSQ
ncbi:site-specific DNA-methyltransferase [Edaphobacter modestus]|uniref:Methyltransferase n=1 Tax=Edaphobacter modestus TaxID=388466 RepID=A0A4Q7YXD5_9BACT|nr:DNA methyltransferase [Edaphobacter modestus]RZU42410.1 DNA modification methylase [Edaphobacter modestus]